MTNKKSTLQEIITKGSLKNRLTLWFNVQHSGDKPLLTPQEKDALYNSFETVEERRAFNELERKREVFNRLFMHLDTHRHAYRYHMARLSAFVMLFYSYEIMEEALNNTLYVIDDRETKKRVLDTLKAQELTLAEFISSKDEGLIEISKGREFTLKNEASKFITDKGGVDLESSMLLGDILHLEKLNATRGLAIFKAFLLVIKKIMKEEGFKSPIHVRMIAEYEDEANEYQGPIKAYNPEYVLKNIPRNNAKVIEALEKFNFYPTYETTEPNKEIYEWAYGYYLKRSGGKNGS